MRKIRFILEEFLRSFRRSIWKNILLIPMFAISLVMAVIMCSYYFDIGERYSGTVQHIGESEWHNMQTENQEEFFANFSMARGCRTVIEYYEDYFYSGKFHIIASNVYQNAMLRKADLERIFGERDYTAFLNPDRREVFTGPFGEEVCKLQEIQCAQINVGAWEMFGLRAAEGEGITKQNTTLAKNTDPVPVVVGNDYRGILEIGDTLEIAMYSYIYPCKVVGILEKGASLPEYSNLSYDTVSMDFYIVFPYEVHLPALSAGVAELEKYAFLGYVALDNGVVELRKEKELTELVNEFQETAENHGMSPVRIMDTSMGMDLLREESAMRIRILSILTLTLFGFTFYGMFITFYDKVQTNSRTYGIYLANGCPLGAILVSCLLEVAVILFPGLLASWYLFTEENVGYFNMDAILCMAYLFTALAFLAGGVVIALLLHGVDTEQLLRQKE